MTAGVHPSTPLPSQLTLQFPSINIRTYKNLQLAGPRSIKMGPSKPETTSVPAMPQPTHQNQPLETMQPIALQPMGTVYLCPDGQRSIR